MGMMGVDWVGREGAREGGRVWHCNGVGAVCDLPTGEEGRAYTPIVAQHGTAQHRQCMSFELTKSPPTPSQNVHHGRISTLIVLSPSPTYSGRVRSVAKCGVNLLSGCWV